MSLKNKLFTVRFLLVAFAFFTIVAAQALVQGSVLLLPGLALAAGLAWVAYRLYRLSVVLQARINTKPGKARRPQVPVLAVVKGSGGPKNAA